MVPELFWLTLALAGVHQLARWTEAIGPLLLGLLAAMIAILLAVSPLIFALVDEGRRGGLTRVAFGGVHIQIDARDRDSANHPDAGTPAHP